MPNQVPHGSALQRLMGGERVDAVEAKRDDLRGTMMELERALDEAEQRDARIAARRRNRVAVDGEFETNPDRVGQGRPS